VEQLQDSFAATVHADRWLLTNDHSSSTGVLE